MGWDPNYLSIHCGYTAKEKSAVPLDRLIAPHGYSKSIHLFIFIFLPKRVLVSSDISCCLIWFQREMLKQPNFKMKSFLRYSDCVRLSSGVRGESVNIISNIKCQIYNSFLKFIRTKNYRYWVTSGGLSLPVASVSLFLLWIDVWTQSNAISGVAYHYAKEPSTPNLF